MKMKKVFLLCLMAFSAFAITACSDDDDNSTDNAINQSYIKYQLTLSDHFLQFYDISATCTDLDGTTHQYDITNKSWIQKWSENTDKGKLSPKITIIATLKPSYDTHTAQQYTLSYEFRANWYSKTNTAKSHSTKTSSVFSSSEKLEAFLAKYPQITIVKYPSE